VTRQQEGITAKYRGMLVPGLSVGSATTWQRKQGLRGRLRPVGHEHNNTHIGHKTEGHQRLPSLSKLSTVVTLNVGHVDLSLPRPITPPPTRDEQRRKPSLCLHQASQVSLPWHERRGDKSTSSATANNRKLNLWPRPGLTRQDGRGPGQRHDQTSLFWTRLPVYPDPGPIPGPAGARKARSQ